MDMQPLRKVLRHELEAYYVSEDLAFRHDRHEALKRAPSFFPKCS